MMSRTRNFVGVEGVTGEIMTKRTTHGTPKGVLNTEAKYQDLSSEAVRAQPIPPTAKPAGKTVNVPLEGSRAGETRIS